MSHMGFSLHRGRGYENKMKVGSLAENKYRLSVTAEDILKATQAARAENISRPRVFLDVNIDATPTGRIVIELFTDLVPKTCENFRALCTGEKGFCGGSSGANFHYKGNHFYKIVPNKFIECGDFAKNNGTSGESIYGWRFDDEAVALRHAEAGLVSMCNDNSPHTNGSRFMITLDALPQLDGKHVIFGRVIAGMDVVRKVEALGTNLKGQVSEKVTHLQAAPDALVAFRTTRIASVRECGQLERAAAPLALQDEGAKPAKRARLEIVRGFHILKKHKTCRRPTDWRGKAVTCTAAKAKQAMQNLRRRLELAPCVQQLFIELAREHSDEASAQKGGDLGDVERGSGVIEEEIEDHLFALHPGQLSEVLETNHGVHLILRPAV